MNRKLVSLILTGLGVAGVGVTSWLSAKCCKKVKDDDTILDKAKTYAPAIASGVITSGCIIGSNRVSAKALAMATASCGAVVANRDKIKKVLNEKLGFDKAKSLLRKADNETISDIPKSVSIEHTPYGTVEFYDSYSGRRFYSSLNRVKYAQEAVQQMIREGHPQPYNTLFELYGIEKNEWGARNGWPCDPDYYDVGSYGHDIVLDFENEPKRNADTQKIFYIIHLWSAYPYENYWEYSIDDEYRRTIEDTEMPWR